MMSVSSQAIKNKMQLQIEDILRKASFSPTHVEVINESFDHTGIKQSDEPELASHLKIIVVSPQFEKKALLQVSFGLTFDISLKLCLGDEDL